MSKTPTVPTVDQLKRAVLDGSPSTMLRMALSDIIVIHALMGAGQAVESLREQLKRMRGERDEIRRAVTDALGSAEVTLQLTAEAVHKVLTELTTTELRRQAAWFN
jgi:hypothetical protein